MEASRLPAGVEILCGSSGSGKTDEALRRYAEQVGREGEDTALLILPTARLVRQARVALVGEGRLPGLVDPRLFTFPQLARIILSANHETATPISRTAQELLLREVIERQRAGGELAALAQVSDLPGFVTALLDLVGDLKRAAVDPKQFCAAMAEAGLARPWHGEIGRLYCEYQWLLICLRCFDEEGLFWWARHVLDDGRRRPLERVQLMIVDGFTDFTTTQLQMLAALASDIPQTLVTLDYSPDDPREGLSAWFGDTYRRLAERLPAATVTELPLHDAAGPLAHLRRWLFSPPNLAAPAAAEGRVRILECPSRSREIREVLRRAKRLLTAGRARPGEIAIIFRDLAKRASTVAPLARRMGVPVHIEAPIPPTTSPAVQAVLRAYQTVAAGYRREDVIALLRSGYLTLLDGAVTADDIAGAARAALVLDGRNEWRERLAAYRKRVQAGTADERIAIPVIRAAAQAVRRVFDLLPDPRARSLLDRVAETRRFLREARVWDNVACGDLPGHASADMRALDLFEQGLDELEHSRHAGDELAAGAYGTLLQALLENMGDAPPPARGDRISVIDARSARQLRFRICFAAGLNEGDFPRHPTDEPFFSRRELAELGRAGVDLERRRSPEAEEPVLFHAAVSAATEELWLSYAGSDAEGKPLQPSYYLEEVRRLFADPIDEPPIRVSEIVVACDQTADPQEVLDRAFFDLAERDSPTPPTVYNALLQLPGSAEVVRRLAEGISVEDSRRSPAPEKRFVGILESASILDDVRQRFGAEHCFTGGGLTDYAACPFAFFGGKVLSLVELSKPEPEVDPLAAGRVRHRVLGAFCRARRDRRPGEPLIQPGEEAEATAELHAVVDREYARFAQEVGVAEPALWEIDREQCRGDMRRWVAQEVERFGDQIPVDFEVRFGRGDCVVALPGHPDIHFSGRIDRVNRLPGDPAPGFVLLDYKSGQPPSTERIRQGLELQFPVYVMGAPVALPALAGVPCDSWHYWTVKGQVQVSPKKPLGTDAIREIIEAVTPLVAEYVEGIRDGWFSTEGRGPCPRYCEFRDVCREAPWRKIKETEDAEGTDDGA